MRWALVGLVAVGSASANTVEHAPTTAVSLGRPTTQGPGLTPQVIRRVLKGARDDLRACYEVARATNPTLQGAVAATFTVTPQGRVIDARATGMTPPALARCVAKQLAALRFPRPAGGASVIVTYPLTFRALDERVDPDAPGVEYIASEARGSFDPSIDGNVVLRAEREVLECYTRALAVNATLAGEAQLELAIATSGAVAMSRATGLDPGVDACLTAASRRWMFLSREASAQVRYTLTFGPVRSQLPRARALSSLSSNRSPAHPGKGVTVGTPTVKGDYDAAVARRYLKRSQAKLSACYDAALVDEEELAGALTATFSISPSGRTSRLKVTGLGHSGVESCVTKVIEGILFPVPTAGAVTVTEKMTFAPD